MKTKVQLLPILLLLIVVAVFTNSCTTVHLAPSKRQVSKRLPSLEPLIEIQAMENAYIKKSSSGSDVLCRASQNFNNFSSGVYTNDFASVYYNDVTQNITDGLLDYKGSIVCKITDRKEDTGVFVPGLILGIVTLTNTMIWGVPTMYDEQTISIDIDVININNDLVKTYKGNGNATTHFGMYNGVEAQRNSNAESLIMALDGIKAQISSDSQFLTDALNQGMAEIQQEREISLKQSSIQTKQLITANKQFEGTEYEAALELYNLVLAEYPNHLPALLNRGKTLSKLSKHTSSIADFTRVIELDPKNVDAYYARGLAYSNLLEMYAAIYNYDKTIALAPDMISAYLMRAAAEEDLALNENAIKDYQQVLKLNPDFVLAKQRVNVIQNKIQQNIEEQAQLDEQARIDRLNAMNSALNQLSSSLNSLNNLNQKTTSNPSTVANTPVTTNTKNSHIVQVPCLHCHGTKVDPNPSYVANFGLGNRSDKACPDCGKYENHYHKTCPICKGKGYTEKFVK